MDQANFSYRIDVLTAAIGDSHQRMATNRDPMYRGEQQALVDQWLEEMSQLHESYVELWINHTMGVR
jgi:hypothetical protein